MRIYVGEFKIDLTQVNEHEKYGDNSYLKCINNAFPKIYHTRSIVLEGCGLCLWIALGLIKFGNKYS